MSKLVALKAENFKKLIAIEIAFKDGVTEIRGKNAAGKSSTLDAVLAAVGGKKCEPDLPIRKGESQSKISLETDELLVKKVWTAKDDGSVGVRLEVIDKATKGRLPGPQAILDKLMGPQQVDPLAFVVRMTPKEQAAKMREIAGIDTTELDEERDVVFAQRTGVNRELQTLKARFEAMPEPQEFAEPAPEIDGAAVLTKLEEAMKEERRQEDCRRSLAHLKSQLTDKRKLQQELRERLDLLLLEIDVVEGRITKGDEVVAAFVAPNLTAIKAEADEIAKSNANTRTAREAKREADRKADAYHAIKQQLAEVERTWKDHTARLAEIDQAKAKMLAEAKFPVRGLGLDGDTVTFEGIPLEQAAQSQKIKVGVAIAAACCGSLRAVICHDGSLLDEDSQRDMAAAAAEHDLQILLEIVGDGPGGIVIEDGLVKSN